MRQALIDQKGWTDEELPHVNTIGVILNRLGYKLRRVQKTKPLKKIPETEAIFENVRQENQTADDSPDVVRISMDAKAKVDVGDFSRDGESRAAEAPRALDHDTQAKTKLVPYGILDVTSSLLRSSSAHRTRPVTSLWTAWNSGGRRTKHGIPPPASWWSTWTTARRTRVLGPNSYTGW